MKYGEYITQLGFTHDELDILSDTDEKLRNNFFAEFSRAQEEYNKGDSTFAEYLSEFSEKSGIPINTLNLSIYLHLIEATYAEYEKRGIDKSVFLGTMYDFSVVSRLPLDLGGAFGLPQPVYRSWMRLCIDCSLYRLGRLEFEIASAPCDIEIDGRSLKKGETCISVHIPRADPFSEDAFEESFSQAEEFFKRFYNMDKIIYICDSWLLYPWLLEVLPDTSSIAGFQKKFKIIQVNENNVGLDWIFGSGIGSIKPNQPIENLPEDTSLRRAAKKRLYEGKKLGTALGVR
mgnify:CR=1 FL=1